ncbi:golgin subfamily A member 6-like protein 22 isoform X3 [Senna tora]|uniref:Golgin subfamily A member 6-like protein 22 isoform X3 n=1 Tax=Senna tora TaxID=362788 RepID=A0A834XHF5_9FABA|nr:golgin subfamily A member 6-like protein 22 isoform X3 [Senna tora]
MADDYGFTPEEMAVNDNLGYPKAYAKLCRDRCFNPYSHGPPFTFMPYALHDDEAARAMDLEIMFPIIDPKAKPTTKPKIFVSLLWKQLSHLGNAGFDPSVIRVDPYGNVLYYHADSASPLAWEIDHWFPCSRGGLTVLSNLRILQRQACKRKKNKLEFLIPWWDFQLGLSVNQFLSIFASSNSDFRHRGFSFMFPEGENQELNASQIVDSHSFPQHFIGLKEEVGLAPAAIVESRKESYDMLALKQLDYNRKPRPMSPAIARKGKGKLLKENEDPDFVKNPYQAIVMARDSLKQREENTRMQAEIQKLDDEVNEMKLRNEEEKLIIQDLESVLIKRRRKAEKCRRLAEAQSSYRTMLEKMIRDTMHQSVIYKEQVRLNLAATNALMARLEAQREICDNAEKELHRKYKQRDDIEKQIRPEWDQGRKRIRLDDSTFDYERDSKPVLYLPGIRPRTPFHKELRVFLEEEQKASEAGLSANEEQNQEEEKEEELKILADNDIIEEKLEEHNKSTVALEDENSIEQKFQKLEIQEGKKSYAFSVPVLQDADAEEDEESRQERGKGNVEKWLQILLENSQDMDPSETYGNETSGTEKIIRQLNQKYPLKEKQLQVPQDKNDDWTEKEDRIVRTGNKTCTDEEACISKENGNSSFEGMERRECHRKEKRLVRSESARTLRRIPSSPSLLLGIRKGMDRIGKKPMVRGDDDGNEDHSAANSFIRSIKSIKKAVKI